MDEYEELFDGRISSSIDLKKQHNLWQTYNSKEKYFRKSKIFTVHSQNSMKLKMSQIEEMKYFWNCVIFLLLIHWGKCERGGSIPLGCHWLC